MSDSLPQIPATILAGHNVSGDDPLADYAKGGPKALIPIAGRPMVAYVVDALAGSRYVPAISIVGLHSIPGESFSVPIDFLPDTHDLLTNAETGLRAAATSCPSPTGVILCGSDVPLITSAMIDTLIGDYFLHTEHDLYYCAIEKSVMEARFPGSARSYVHLREGDFAGGDLSMMDPSLVMRDRALWDRLGEARKSALKQARLIGLWPAVQLFSRRLTIDAAEKRVSKALGIRGRVIRCPFAEVGMDVDKPHQLELVRAEIEARPRNSSAPQPASLA